MYSVNQSITQPAYLMTRELKCLRFGKYAKFAVQKCGKSCAKLVAKTQNFGHKNAGNQVQNFKVIFQNTKAINVIFWSSQSYHGQTTIQKHNNSIPYRDDS